MVFPWVCCKICELRQLALPGKVMKVQSLCIVSGDLRLIYILNCDNNNNNTECSFKTTVLAILFCFFAVRRL